MSDIARDHMDPDIETLASFFNQSEGIALYPTLCPKFDPEHHEFIAKLSQNGRANVVELLAQAGLNGPESTESALESYRRSYELPSFRRLANPDEVGAIASAFQRELNQCYHDLDLLAILLEREGIHCPNELTWAKKVAALWASVNEKHAENPATQMHFLALCRSEMEKNLESAKLDILAKLSDYDLKIEGASGSLDDESVRKAKGYCQSARTNIEKDAIFLALRKISAMDSILGGRHNPRQAQPARRLPRNLRINPLHPEPFDFGRFFGLTYGSNTHNKDFIPGEDELKQALDHNGFIHRHQQQSVSNWPAYFSSLREWLGFSSSSSGGRRRFKTLEMPNLDPKGTNLPGRWIFLQSDPWQGAPFFEDISGKPRIMAIVRPIIGKGDRRRLQPVVNIVKETLKNLLTFQPNETPDEKRFHMDGLIVVLLPGDILGTRTYESFCQSARLDMPYFHWNKSIAFVDDLDLLRVLPLPEDERWLGFQQLVLPRFPEALNLTYQESDAVRQRMFFGRNSELSELINGSAVVFSGRKMGKSSLLHRLMAQSGSDTNQRAVLVGCSGIGNGRSFLLLREIEHELNELVQRESGAFATVSQKSHPAVERDFQANLDAAKDRFTEKLDNTMRILEAKEIRRLYVLLDEADNFIRAEMSETSGRSKSDARSAVSWFLRDKTNKYGGRLRFIFAGYDQIGKIFSDPGLAHSAFANWGSAGPLNLGQLDEPAAKDLITKPLTSLGMLVDPDLCERILDYTSGHASLIQAFCRKLGERIRAKHSQWPLNDVSVEFDDVTYIADEKRVESGLNYQALLEQTLSLNLDIAKAFPLKLVFLALVSPSGLGRGRILGFNPFTVEDCLGQLESEAKMGPTPSLVLSSLDILAQLGLLEDVSDTAEKKFLFKARHYVNVLRTKNGFQNQLRDAVDDWLRTSGKTLLAEPRYVWTMEDSVLKELRQDISYSSLIVGLRGSGGVFLAEALAAPRRDGERPLLIIVEPGTLSGDVEKAVLDRSNETVIVCDLEDQLPWLTVANLLKRAVEQRMSLLIIGGPGSAWELANDLETALTIAGPFSLGAIGAPELEPWTARSLGMASASPSATIPESDKEAILKITSGLLPVMEFLREFLQLEMKNFPDILNASDVQKTLAAIQEKAPTVSSFAKRLALGIPNPFRIHLAGLFKAAANWGYEEFGRGDLPDIYPELIEQGIEFQNSFLDAASWLGLIGEGDSAGTLRVPYASFLGVLIQNEGFVGNVPA